ncbi:MAG: hypothetical protein U1E20_14175 [Methylocystis sp.]|uniref:hypothetical protein n=1 Tax=Methylocystis sp. TaxID=1911079 RepID=UPI003941D58C
MKAALVALIVAASSAMPAAAAQDCAQITQGLRTLSMTISRDADAYWAHRKAYIAAKASPQAAAAAQQAATAHSQASLTKAAIPKNLASLAALLSNAKAQNCLSKEEIHVLREPAFNFARAVNFDQLPTELSTEGKPTTSKPPRMPVK